MGLGVLHRRRAERFAQLLDEADGGPRHHLRSSFDPELAALVKLRHRVSHAAPPISPCPDFRAQLRAALIATAERDGIGATARAEPPQRPARSRLIRALSGRGSRARVTLVAGIALSVMAFAGISQASEHALPGHPLYGLKRSTERAQLALAGSDLERGQLYLDHARTRLDEASTLTGAVGPTLDDMDDTTVAGVSLLTSTAVVGNLAALDLIDGFAVPQRQRLQQLAQARTADQDRIAASVALLDDVLDRSSQLRSRIDCGSTTTALTDELGPLLARCPVHSGPRALTQPPQRQPTVAPSPAPTPGTATDDAPAAPKEETDDQPPAAEQSPAPSAPASEALDPEQLEASPVPSETPPESPEEADEGGDKKGGGLLGGLRRLLEGLLGG